jgi:hypothetical protein
MPRRFFRKFALKRERFRKQWFLAPFEPLLHDPNLWGIRRRTVVPAFSLGLFVAYQPFPGHALAAALLALWLRINIPVATLSTVVVNPLTLGPMYYLAYRVGQELLGIETQPFEFELSLRWLSEQFAEIWLPLTLGCLLLGSLLALIGYVALDMLWRASLADYLAKRRSRRKRSE